MKKKFLDYLYELRSTLQLDIDRLVERQKQPIDTTSHNDYDCELRMRRGEIGSCNKTIDKYLEMHRYEK